MGTHADTETEANYFARCLLMPEKLVRQWIKQNPGDLANDKYTRRLADAFRVPLAVAVKRLDEI